MNNNARRKVAVEEERARKEHDQDENNHGVLVPVAASIVMKILWGARFCRMDCLCILGFIACSFTRWTSVCDKRRHRIVSSVH